MKLVSKLLSSSGPIPPDTDTNRVIAADDTRVKVRPRRGERAAHEMHFGFKAVLERGRLGLVNRKTSCRRPRSFLT